MLLAGVVDFAASLPHVLQLCCNPTHIHAPQGPFDTSACLLTHPLEEPTPVIADCALQRAPPPGAAAPAADAAAGAEGVALSGWANESVVWAGEQVPFVATYNDVSPGALCPPPLVWCCCDLLRSLSLRCERTPDLMMHRRHTSPLSTLHHTPARPEKRLSLPDHPPDARPPRDLAPRPRAARRARRRQPA